MAAKPTKRGRGRAKSTEPQTEPADSPEAPVASSDETANAEETPASAEAAASRERQAAEPAEATETEQPGPDKPGKSDTAVIWSVAHLLVLGLTAVLVAAIVAGAVLYATGGGTDRIEQQAQRLDALATQTQAQTGRLDAAEEAISGLQSQVGQVTAGVSDLQSTVEANRQTLDQMSQSIEELRSAVQASGDGIAGETVTQLQDALATLDERVASLEQGSNLEDITGRIARLEQEISSIREQRTELIQQAESATALGRAHAALAGRIAAGEPFADELAAVAAELPGAPGLENLRPLAADGVPTISDLRSRLADIAAGLPTAEPDDTTAGDGFLQTMRERLEGMVTVSRADEADWSAVLARADEALQRVDIEAAIAEVEQVSAAAPDEVESWLADARARRQAEAGLNELSDAVLRQFAGQQ